MVLFWNIPCCEPRQVGDSDDEVEGFAGPDDSPPVTDRLDISTYGEDCLVPEPYKVRTSNNTIQTNPTVGGDFLTVGFYRITLFSIRRYVYCENDSTGSDRSRLVRLRFP